MITKTQVIKIVANVMGCSPEFVDGRTIIPEENQEVVIGNVVALIEMELLSRRKAGLTVDQIVEVVKEIGDKNASRRTRQH